MKCHACGNELVENAKFCAKCGAKTVAAEPVPEPVSASAPVSVPTADLGCDISKVWPEWELEKQLGRGSYGTVYQAVRKDSNLETRAAIKVISIPSDPSEIDSLRSEGLDMDGSKTFFHNIVNDFVSEIQLMESLKGIQNVVSVEDYKVVEKTGQIGWDIYIRMELLTPFNTYICDKELTEEEVIKLGTDICAALELCSQRNIIHRDIKPENLFVNDFGHFKLGDFGIARKLENVTGGLSQKGSPNYMAPEVANGNDYDARVDTYSLGIVLYRLLNGNRLPFLDTEKQILNPNERKAALDRRLRGEELPAPCNASAEMADIILRACAFDPSLRFGSASEMKKALNDASQGVYVLASVSALDKTTSVRKAPENLDKTTSVRKAPVAAPKTSSDPVIDSFGKKIKRRRMMPKIIAAVVAFLLIVGVAFFFIKSYLDDQDAISTIIADADVLAADNNYEGAIDKIESGLQEYEGSTDLQDKLEEFQQARDQQIAAIIAGTDIKAADDDLTGAVEDIENALAEHPDSKELKTKRDDYLTQIQQRVNAIIADADALAAKGDRKAALAKVRAGLVAYPETTALEEKSEEYIEQIKESTLLEAATLAESEDYLAAMELIEEAQKAYGDNEEYQKAYNSYNTAYIAAAKAEAITAADNFATGGDYLGAIKIIKEAASVIGDSEELTLIITEYEEAYVKSVIKQADELIADMKFDEAKTLLSQSIKNITNNSQLTAKLESIDSLRPVNLNTLHIIDSAGFEKRNGIYVDSFGNAYDGSFHFNYVGYTSPERYAIFNLDKECTTFTGSVVACQETGSNEQMVIQIYVDGVLKHTTAQFGKTSGKLDFRVDVTGGQQLMIKAGLASGYWGNACCSIVNGQLTKNPDAVAANLENEQKNIYDPLNAGLDNLFLIDSAGFSQSSGMFNDSFGKSYTGAYHFEYVGYTSPERYAVFNITQSSSSFSGSIVACQDTGSSEQMVVMIYVDEVLKYTSPRFGKTTGKIDFNVDVSGGQKITIKAGLASGYWGNACCSFVNIKLT